MALNCKVGDLAIVVNTELRDNLGQIVEVLSVQTGHPFSLPGAGHYWQVRAVSGRKTLTYRFNDVGRIVRHAEGPAPDCCLRPVSGLADGSAVVKSVQQDPAIKRARKRMLPTGGIKVLVEASQADSYDPIENAMKRHPGLAREEAEAMAAAYGY